MQKRFLRKAAFTLIMLLILVSASSALAATASKTYTEAKITHVWKCGPISRSSGSTKFTSGKDDNTRIVFAVSGLERYQVVELVNASNVSVSGQAEVPTGQSSGTLSVYSAYQTISSIYLQIRNPYYNTPNASRMTTSGTFSATYQKSISWGACLRMRPEILPFGKGDKEMSK